MKKLWILLVLICSASLIAVPGKKDVFIKVYTPEIAWADSQVESKIIKSFSSQPNLLIKKVSEDNNFKPEFPKDYFNTDILIEWGKEVGSRYVMVVDVQSERIEKRKSFHIPLIFHKYQTYGIIEGEMRLLDIDRNKLLFVYPFKIEEKGSRIFQATMDDDINDPDLHISAPKKIQFFSKLEDKLVLELRKKVRVHLGLR